MKEMKIIVLLTILCLVASSVIAGISTPPLNSDKQLEVPIKQEYKYYWIFQNGGNDSMYILLELGNESKEFITNWDDINEHSFEIPGHSLNEIEINAIIRLPEDTNIGDVYHFSYRMAESSWPFDVKPEGQIPAMVRYPKSFDILAVPPGNDNTPPVPRMKITYEGNKIYAGKTTITFDSSETTDDNYWFVTRWNLGDGTRGVYDKNYIQEHIYQKRGEYTVELCAKDIRDNEACITEQVTVKFKIEWWMVLIALVILGVIGIVIYFIVKNKKNGSEEGYDQYDYNQEQAGSYEQEY